MNLMLLTRSTIAATLLPLAVAVAVDAQTQPGRLSYPATARGSQVDDYHGTRIADPYRWLENTESPETKAWVEAQNRLTFGWLATVPERPALRERLTQVWNYPKHSVPTKTGDRLFFYENSGLLNQSILYVKDGNRPARVLIDPNTLSTDGTVALSTTAESPNGRFVAYSVSTSGSDWQEFRVRDVETGRDTRDTIKFAKFSDASWTRDNRGFFYSGYGAPAEGNALTTVNRNQRIYYHRIGTPQSADEIIFENKQQPDWLYDTKVTHDGTFAVITVFQGTDSRTRLYYIFLDDAKRPRVNAPVVRLIDRLEAENELVHNLGENFLVRTDLGAPKGRLVQIDIMRSEPSRGVTVIPETRDALVSVKVGRDHLITSYLQDARSSVRVYGMPRLMRQGRGTGQYGPVAPSPIMTVPRAERAATDDPRTRTAPGYPFAGEIPLPGIGTVDAISANPDENDIFYSFVSFLTPRSVYRYDLRRRENTVYKAPKLAIDASQFETRQVFYNSKDGTRVPMFITMKKGLALDGTNGTILYGYGGFNISETPKFSPANLVWLERGGIYAVPNLRGGAEYGKEWHEAGTL